MRSSTSYTFWLTTRASLEWCSLCSSRCLQGRSAELSRDSSTCISFFASSCRTPRPAISPSCKPDHWCPRLSRTNSGLASAQELCVWCAGTLSLTTIRWQLLAHMKKLFYQIEVWASFLLLLTDMLTAMHRFQTRRNALIPRQGDCSFRVSPSSYNRHLLLRKRLDWLHLLCHTLQ